MASGIPSYSLKDRQVVSVREKSRTLAVILEATAMPERDIPAYLEVDQKEMSVCYLQGPTLEDIPYPVRMEPNLVVEYYSR